MIVVETKSTERVPQSALRQLFSHLKASRLEVGWLLHFDPEPKFHRQIFKHSDQTDQRPIRTDQTLEWIRPMARIERIMPDST